MEGEMDIFRLNSDCLSFAYKAVYIFNQDLLWMLSMQSRCGVYGEKSTDTMRGNYSNPGPLGCPLFIGCQGMREHADNFILPYNSLVIANRFHHATL